MNVLDLLRQAFYTTYCKAKPGERPVCAGCVNYERTPVGNRVCTHSEHPENKAAYREMAGGK